MSAGLPPLPRRATSEAANERHLAARRPSSFSSLRNLRLSRRTDVASKVTLQDVADAAGVHRSTVALALKNSRRISATQRKKIQSLAREMGYRVNPLVAALMKSRRSGHKMKAVTIAYVTCYPTRWGWRPPHVDRPDYFPGAAARATELGYKLEAFWLGEPSMTATRFCDILTNRAINGVLVGRLPANMHAIELVWDRFSCVALGRTLRSPTLHRVTEDHYASAALAMDQLIAAGYRRIGFVFSEPDDSPAVGDRWLGGYLRKQLSLAKTDTVPPLMFVSEETANASFAQWFNLWKPDALLVTQADPVLRWLNDLGLRVPRDVGLATLVNDHLDRGWMGIHSDPNLMGALATETVVGLMHRGETGVPAVPHEVLLRGEWVSGRTIRP